MKLTIKKGDFIEVKAQGMTVRGTVLYACDWNNDNTGWDIEIGGANIAGGYSHWKQVYDKGFVSMVNGVHVCEMLTKDTVIDVLHKYSEQLLADKHEDNFTDFLTVMKRMLRDWEPTRSYNSDDVIEACMQAYTDMIGLDDDTEDYTDPCSECKSDPMTGNRRCDEGFCEHM
jgi:hypothetical protein